MRRPIEGMKRPASFSSLGVWHYVDILAGSEMQKDSALFGLGLLDVDNLDTSLLHQGHKDMACRIFPSTSGGKFWLHARPDNFM